MSGFGSRVSLSVQRMENGDFLLGAFAGMAQNHGLETGMTLVVSGTVITGTLISKDSWVELVAQATESTPGPGNVAFGCGIRLLFEEAAMERLTAGEVDDPDVYRFVHLKDAIFIQGDMAPPSFEGGLWRVRISEVGGWCLGIVQR